MIYLLFLAFVTQDSNTMRLAKDYSDRVSNTVQMQLRPVQENIEMYERDIERTKAYKLDPQAPSEGRNLSGVQYFRNKQEASMVINKLQDELKALEDQKKKLWADPLGIIDVDELEKGQVGYLGKKAYPERIKIMQILGPDSALVRVGDRTILARDFKTSGFADNTSIFLPLVEIVGTERYTTAIGGSNQVYVARVLTKEEHEEVERFAAEKNQPPRKLRVWKDLQNKVIANAEFVKHEKEKVFVITEEGKESELEYAKLSRSDRAWIKENSAKYSK